MPRCWQYHDVGFNLQYLWFTSNSTKNIELNVLCNCILLKIDFISVDNAIAGRDTVLVQMNKSVFISTSTQILVRSDYDHVNGVPSNRSSSIRSEIEWHMCARIILIHTVLEISPEHLSIEFITHDRRISYRKWKSFVKLFGFTRFCNQEKKVSIYYL